MPLLLMLMLMRYAALDFADYNAVHRLPTLVSMFAACRHFEPLRRREQRSLTPPSRCRYLMLLRYVYFLLPSR